MPKSFFPPFFIFSAILLLLQSGEIKSVDPRLIHVMLMDNSTTQSEVQQSTESLVRLMVFIYLVMQIPRACVTHGCALGFHSGHCTFLALSKSCLVKRIQSQEVQLEQTLLIMAVLPNHFRILQPNYSFRTDIFGICERYSRQLKL